MDPRWWRTLEFKLPCGPLFSHISCRYGLKEGTATGAGLQISFLFSLVLINTRIVLFSTSYMNSHIQKLINNTHRAQAILYLVEHTCQSKSAW